MTTDKENHADALGFVTTHWSVVSAAGNRSSPDQAEALEWLCRTYWYPLYSYVRRRVTNVAEAEDLTQQFFTTLLEKDYFAAADRERGRFRSFLLAAFKHFMAKEWRKSKAVKRGGGRLAVPMDFVRGEARFATEGFDSRTPEKAFEREWAIAVMDNVLSRLRAEYVEKGKKAEFDQLKAFLGGAPDSESYIEAAASLRMSINAAYLAVHRMRRRYRELLRAEVAQTVADTADVDEEIRDLFAALGN